MELLKRSSFFLQNRLIRASITGRMKKEIHAENYRLVVFVDATTGAMFLTGSTMPTKETIKYTDGKEYPKVMVETSSSSHPFYTGQEKQLDTAGRAEKFKTRAAKAGTKAKK
jgi:large subunit ribosomal protein L31